LTQNKSLRSQAFRESGFKLITELNTEKRISCAVPLPRDKPNFLQVDTNQELKIINAETGDMKFSRYLAADFPDLVSVKKVAVAREFIFIIVEHGEDSMLLAYELLKGNGHSLICGG